VNAALLEVVADLIGIISLCRFSLLVGLISTPGMTRRITTKSKVIHPQFDPKVVTFEDMCDLNYQPIQAEILQINPKPTSMFAFSRPSCKTDARC
jgi:hypothetical protein